MRKRGIPLCPLDAQSAASLRWSPLLTAAPPPFFPSFAVQRMYETAKRLMEEIDSNGAERMCVVYGRVYGAP